MNLKYILCLATVLLELSSFSPAFAIDTAIPTTEQASARNLNYQKPSPMAALAWLQQLEEERDQAELNHQFDIFEALSREVSATLAGKYGFASRKATEEEAQLMFASVLKTRDFYAGKPDIINDFYFGYDKEGCWKKTAIDPQFKQHMAIITAVDAIRWGAVTDRPVYDQEGNIVPYQRGQNNFEELFSKQRRQSTADHTFKEAIARIVTDIHDDEDEDRLKGLLTSISEKNWKDLVDRSGLLMDVMAPPIDLQTIFEELFVLGDETYRGWNVHRIDQLASWYREGDECLQWVKKYTLYLAKTMRMLIHPLFRAGIMLHTGLINEFQGLETKYFDNGYLGVKYLFYLPLTNPLGIDVLQPIYFYLTRKVPMGLAQKEHKALVKEVLSPELLQQRDATLFKSMRAFALGLQPFGVSPENKEKKLQEAAQLGFIPALNRYALVIEKNTPTKAGMQKPIELLKLAADREINDAHTNYASRMFDASSMKTARAYYKMEVAAGIKVGLYEYGYFLSKGLGGKQDPFKARRYYKMAADEGEIINPAMLNPPFMEKIYLDAQQKMAEIQSLDGFNEDNYGDMYRDFMGQIDFVIQSYENYKQKMEAIRLSDPGKGIPSAQYNYAIMCLNGRGGPRDLQEAKKYCEMAGQNGFAEARGLLNTIEMAISQEQLFFLASSFRRPW